MIENFCSDVFWDANATWNSSVPDFSTCFQDTILVFIPCLVFSIIGIFNLYFLSGCTAVNPLPYTWRLILKQLLGVLLCVVSATWCILYFFEVADCENRSISRLIALFARPIIYVIVIILMIKHRNRGITTSAVLSLFWICFAVTNAVIHRSVILKYDSKNIDWNFVICNINCIFIYTELILSFFADARNFDHLVVGSPLEEEALFSNVTYMWFNRIVYRAVKRLLTVKDFLPLSVKLKSSRTYEIFSRHWKFHLQSSDLQKQSLSWALLKSFWPWLILGLILDVLYVLLLLVPPLVLEKKMYAIVKFIKEDDAPGVVSTNWIDFENNICWYPCVSTEERKNKLLFARAPPKKDWMQCPIKVLKQYSTYIDAKSNLTDAEYTSNVESEDGENKTKSRKRKQRVIRLPGEESSSGDEKAISKKTKKVRPTLKNLCAPPVPPQSKPHIYRETEGSDISRFLSENVSPSQNFAGESSIQIEKTPNKSHPFSSSTFIDTLPETPTAANQQESAGEESDSLLRGLKENNFTRFRSFDWQKSGASEKKNEDEIKRIKASQTEMWSALGQLTELAKANSTKLDSIILKLEQQQYRKDAPEIDEVQQLMNLLPIELENFDNLNENIEKNVSFRRSLLQILMASSGKDAKSMVAGMLRKLMTDEVGEKFSLTGKQLKGGVSKESFEKTILYKLIREACFRVHREVKENVIREGISDWLMQSKFRKNRSGILEFVKDDFYSWRSYFFCASLFISSFLNKTLQNNYIMYLLCVGAQVRSALISAIFRKNLLLASSKRKEFSSGAITNLVSVDVQRIGQFSLYSTSLISAPFRIILVISVMWQYLGPSCLAGVAVIVILIPISFFVARMNEKYLDQQMKVKDIRLKYMNEILQGIKILKFYAWEIPFSLKVSETRKKEIKFIRLSQMCFVISCFVYCCAPILVSLASFTTFLLIDEKHILDPVRAFVSLNLLNQLRLALILVPDSISELIQTITALDRIKTFLMSEEIDPAVVNCNPDEGNVISVKNASLYWSEETSFKLENIDLNISGGSLIAVIGSVGSGKSSLLSAFLGEMYKISGSIDIKGNLAYVPQEAWILNRSVKYNILLEKSINEEIYNRILDCCCLRPDLKILPAGDGTEIGEKGINLSGGQKQRISLARAVFQNRDIYLLDDPLSAVDAHVRKALFEDVIGNQGLLKNKTRLLVTHDISILPYVDVIIRMEEGKILERGTYEQLLDSSETFKNFIRTHSGQIENCDNLDSVEKILSKEAGDTQKKIYDRAISDDSIKLPDVKQSGATLIEEEKMEEGGVKRGIYLNYMQHVGWPMLLLALLGYIAYTGLEAGGNVWVADWSSDPILNATHDNSRTIWRLSVYGGFGVAQAFTNIFGVACMVYGSTKASELYHNQMLDSILKSPMSFFDVTPMGRIVNRFATDMDTLDIHIVHEIDGWIYCALWALSIFLVIGINTPIFLASIIPLGLLYYVFLKLHLNTSRQIMRLQSTTRSPIYSRLLESIYGVSSIKAFKVETEFIEKFEENVDNHIACVFNISSANRWLHFWLDFIGSVVLLVATSLSISNRHNLGPSLVGLIVTYALSVTDALMWLVRSNTELENKTVAVERVHEYCLLESEAPWSKPENDPAITWPENGKIVFDNYSTRYRENLDLVLKDVNMNIHSNEKVGIVGRTGAGKSSITLALFRIIEPVSGTILVDNIDLSKIGLHALRSKLTIIPQDPVLFTGSLRFNLDPNDEFSDDDIWKSLENSHLKDFVSGLSEGLQHTIDEGGGNLSAGQKQLLCLSRALLKKSKVLVLDEATAAVDMDTDSLVQETIKSAFADHTVVTIAHRLNTVLDYDKIIVMDAGTITEVGKPGDLLKNKNSQFYKMAQDAGLV